MALDRFMEAHRAVAQDRLDQNQIKILSIVCQQQMDFRLSCNNQDLDWVTDLNLDETMTPPTEFIVSGAEFNQKLDNSLSWEMDLNQILEQSNSANLSAPNTVVEVPIPPQIFCKPNGYTI